MKYPKHFLVIRDKQFNIGNDLNIDEDLDRVFLALDFPFPSLNTGAWSTKDLTKYDRIQLYYKNYDTISERDAASISTMPQVFDGYIDRLEESEDKSTGCNYQIYCKSTAALSYERSTQIASFDGDIRTLLSNSLAQINILEYIPDIKINGISYNSGLPNPFDVLLMKVGTQKFLGKVFDEIKSKYALNIYQVGDGTLHVRTPRYFTDQDQEVKVFDMQSNIFNMNYGEISQQVDTVVVIGTNSIGLAFDPIAYQLKLGTPPGQLVSSITPARENMNPRYVYRRDLVGNEACQEVARNMLVEFAKNYSITFDTEYYEDVQLGDMFLINNSSRISPSQKWIVKRRVTKIGKTTNRSTITAYSNSISDFPEDILRSATGILDTDILEVGNKADNLLKLHN